MLYAIRCLHSRLGHVSRTLGFRLEESGFVLLDGPHSYGFEPLADITMLLSRELMVETNCIGTDILRFYS